MISKSSLINSWQPGSLIHNKKDWNQTNVFPQDERGNLKTTKSWLLERSVRSVVNIDRGSSVWERSQLLLITNLLEESFLCLFIAADQLLHHHHLSCSFVSHLWGTHTSFEAHRVLKDGYDAWWKTDGSPWWPARKSLFPRLLRGWGHTVGKCDESSYWRISETQSVRCLVLLKATLWVNLVQETYIYCYYAWNKIKKDILNVMHTFLSSVTHPQHGGWTFQTLQRTSKTSFSACCLQPCLFSPGPCQTARTDAYGTWLGLPAGCWVIPVWAGPNAAWLGRTLWAAAARDWYDEWGRPPTRAEIFKIF